MTPRPGARKLRALPVPEAIEDYEQVSVYAPADAERQTLLSTHETRAWVHPEKSAPRSSDTLRLESELRRRGLAREKR